MVTRFCNVALAKSSNIAVLMNQAASVAEAVIAVFFVHAIVVIHCSSVLIRRISTEIVCRVTRQAPTILAVEEKQVVRVQRVRWCLSYSFAFSECPRPKRGTTATYAARFPCNTSFIYTYTFTLSGAKRGRKSRNLVLTHCIEATTSPHDFVSCILKTVP